MNFERHINPKEALGIGIFSPRTFPTDVIGARFIIIHLPVILKTKRIPYDILHKPNGTYGINKKYEKSIEDYTVKYIHIEESFRLPDGVPDASLLWCIGDYLKFIKNELRKRK
jgi:hypothetical protein